MPNGIHVPKVVFTGGPCAGKTTGMSFCDEKLKDHGFKTFVCPEVATLSILGGFNPFSASERELVGFEERLLSIQLALEDHFVGLAGDYVTAHPKKKAVVLCDRGAMDVRAYLSDNQFGAILDDLNLRVAQIRDKRYEGVIHLVTAANGAEKFYTCDNNKARRESKEEAREKDQKTQDAWVGAPHLQIIDNSTDFEGKIKRVYQSICRVLGVPVPIEHERKYLVSSFDREKFPHHEVINIEQVYLLGGKDDEEIRVRKRGQDSSFCYYKTHKRPTGESGKRYETEWPIDGKEYCEELLHADPRRVPIAKDRICFLWEGQYFELDVIKAPEKHAGKFLLEIELTEEADDIKMPSFIHGAIDVTDDGQYSNSALALK